MGPITFTSFITCILLASGMNLIGQMKILTDCGRYGDLFEILNSTISKCYKSLENVGGNKLLFLSKGG